MSRTSVSERICNVSATSATGIINGGLCGNNESCSDGIEHCGISKPSLCGIQPNGIAFTDDGLVADNNSGHIVVEIARTIHIAESGDVVLCSGVGRNGDVNRVAVCGTVGSIAGYTVVIRCGTCEVELQNSCAVANIIGIRKYGQSSNGIYGYCESGVVVAIVCGCNCRRYESISHSLCHIGIVVPSGACGQVSSVASADDRLVAHHYCCICAGSTAFADISLHVSNLIISRYRGRYGNKSLMSVASSVGCVACYAVNKWRGALEVDFELSRLVVADIESSVAHSCHGVVEHQHGELA